MFYFYDKNIDKNGNHQIHKNNCTLLKDKRNQPFIGYHSVCNDAINRAKQEHSEISFDVCDICCNR